LGTGDIYIFFGTGDIYRLLGTGNTYRLSGTRDTNRMLGTGDTYRLFGTGDPCYLFFTVILQSVWHRGYLKIVCNRANLSSLAQGIHKDYLVNSGYL
jgi:hypothetical protein